MMMKVTLFILTSAALARGQRPTYAGSRPIGYPVVTTTPSGLADRFGEGNTTTPALPIEAMGDRELVDRLSKFPIDKQPFWLINWQALEAHRQKPQTYPQKPNVFTQPLNTGNSNVSNMQITNTDLPIPSSGNAIPNPGNAIPITGNVGIPNNSGNAAIPISDNAAIPISGDAVIPISGNVAIPNSVSTSAVPSSNRDISSIPNSNSANTIAVNPDSSTVGVIADRFGGGIEPNRYHENEPVLTNSGSVNSNRKPGIAARRIMRRF